MNDSVVAGAAASGERFVFLDGLRGVAASAVVFLHAFAIMKLEGPAMNAGLAVDFFFCLSGFVISHAYDRRLARGLGFRAFMLARIRRLYPMIALGIVLGVGASLLAGDAVSKVAFEAVAAAVLFPILWTGPLAYPLNLPMWSLFFEFAANAAYALAGVKISNRLLALAVIAGGIVLGVLAWLADGLDFGVGGKSFPAGAFRVFYPFAAGVLIHRLALWRRAPVLNPWLLAAAVAALLYSTVQGWAYDVVVGILLLPVFVVLGAAAKTGGSDALWSYLGRLSYPLYLVHVPVLVAAHALKPDASPLIGMTVGPALTFVAAHLALSLYEQPVLKLLSRSQVRLAAS